MIQWSRACDETFKPDVDELERKIVPERDDQGRVAEPLAYLNARATKILALFDAPVDKWLERVRRVKISSALIVIALGALAFPFARVDTILGSGVNLAGPFLFFLLTQIFFLTCALVLACLVILMSVVRHLLGHERPVSFSEKVVQTLSSVVGSLAIWAFHRFAPVFYAFWGKPSTGRFAWHNQSSAARRAREENPEAAKKEERRREEARGAIALFWDVLFSRPRVVAFWGGALSHTFWTSCSLCVLLILVARMQGNRYDYCWHTSLEDERVVKQGVDLLGAPVALLGVAVPNEDDVAALFTDMLVKPGAASSTSSARKTAAETRAKWSYFLLAIVFVWCVVPRLVLIGVYYLLYRHALRDFKPQLADEYFHAVIERVEAYCSTTKSETVPEREDDKVLEQEPISSPAAPIWNSSPSRKRSAPVKETPSEKEPSEFEKNDVVPASVGVQDRVVRLQAGNEDGLTRVSSDVASAPVPKKPEVIPDAQPVLPTAGSDVVERKEDVVANESNVAGSSSEAARERAKNDVEPEELSGVVSSAEPGVGEPSPIELEERRLVSALATCGGLTESAFVYAPEPPGLALAFGYDFRIESALIRELVGTDRELVYYGDAADSDEKKKLKERLETDGSRILWCTIFTDVGLPPARHFVRFMRDTLIPSLSAAAQIVVVLSGGERMRLKFSTAANAVTERIEDWTRTLEAMAKASGKQITPVFYYDAELNLPESRARLHAFLSGKEELERLRQTPRDLKKWNAASAMILAECHEIFDAKTFVTSDEADRLRIARVSGEIFKIYSEELGKASYAGRSVFSSGLGGELVSRLSSTNLGEGLTRRVEELGLTPDFVESRIMAACGLGVRLRSLSGKLSPRCALAAASFGATVPLVVAFAPLLGGAVTATALLSTIGAVGAALPASLASGAVAGALGALVPESLRTCKLKFAERLGFKSGSPRSVQEPTVEASRAPSSQERVDSAAALACTTSAWAATLELQGLAEDAIVEALPVVLRAFEELPLDSLSSVEEALKGARRALENIPPV